MLWCYYVMFQYFRQQIVFVNVAYLSTLQMLLLLCCYYCCCRRHRQGSEIWNRRWFEIWLHISKHSYGIWIGKCHGKAHLGNWGFCRLDLRKQPNERSRVPLEKIIIANLVELPAFYGTWKCPAISQAVFFLQVFLSKLCTHFSYLPFITHVRSMVSSLLWSFPSYLARSTFGRYEMSIKGRRNWLRILSNDGLWL
jgi:hypothetical protein